MSQAPARMWALQKSTFKTRVHNLRCNNTNPFSSSNSQQLQLRLTTNTWRSNSTLLNSTWMNFRRQVVSERIQSHRNMLSLTSRCQSTEAGKRLFSTSMRLWFTASSRLPTFRLARPVVNMTFIWELSLKEDQSRCMFWFAQELLSFCRSLLRSMRLYSTQRPCPSMRILLSTHLTKMDLFRFAFSENTASPSKVVILRTSHFLDDLWRMC